MKNLREKAELIARTCHLNQLDKGGEPYINHPMFVASQFADESSYIVGMLHDVLEDSNYTTEQLKSDGFSQEIISAIMLLTKKPGISYTEYIINIASNPIARSVKIADLKHNMDLERIKNIKVSDLKRVEKYKIALQILESKRG